MSDDAKPGRKPRVTDEEILQLFRETDDPVLSTGEVTEQLSIGRSATYKRLKSLREGGRLQAKTIGKKNTVYWLDEAEKGET
ncbi:hypothetical protein DJ69_08525 [Halorubrum persicum]|uniref:Uncharacterized protein n=1 Tax=Halorubrum persicum TaxID=1383844 RepID=A0A2G1WJ22_9EURY|nr:HTH domain-containing protein [Halorubrum persicum]PHQ38980.1 hypothetical protein DJ69_08525 [Halorubrum persicum]